MKRIFTIAFTMLGFVVSGSAQGIFTFWNGGATRTRIGSIDGPYAGPDILAQMLIGLDAGSLTPVGVPVPHQAGTGLAAGGNVTVPGIPGSTYVFAQMVAWNETFWGPALADVPLNQRGYTDVVPLFLTYSFDPHLSPQFTQPAIVPVPEPAGWALVALAGSAALLGIRRSRARSPFVCPRKSSMSSVTSGSALPDSLPHSTTRPD